MLSSGDPVADRRHAYAAGLAEAGDHSAAAEVMEQALEAAPGWAAGWFVLAGYREAAGDMDGAAAALGETRRLDTDDRLGAALHLARLGRLDAPPVPPQGYVRALFDDYAPRFDKALIGALGYRAPTLIADALDGVAPGRRFGRALDLGCGTGLMGAAIRARVDRLAGVDLSPRMIAEAAARCVYDDLRVDDVVGILGASEKLDLVTAADVFCYLGDLAPVLAAARRALAPGGLAAFTVEDAGAGPAPWVLQESLRYAHGKSYVFDAVSEVGQLLVMKQTWLRLDRGAKVEGLVVVFTAA
jgi:predicted TPR repeat methyltransferase